MSTRRLQGRNHEPDTFPLRLSVPHASRRHSLPPNVLAETKLQARHGADCLLGPTHLAVHAQDLHGGMMAPHELEAALSGHRGNGECKPVVISKCAHGNDAGTGCTHAARLSPMPMRPQCSCGWAHDGLWINCFAHCRFCVFPSCKKAFVETFLDLKSKACGSPLPGREPNKPVC